ncbi:hypothetical protein C8N25_10152 [Algoriphagus antarcticus]|uniref:Uncharacterized protein n=2 Tax=Algoriphagus antarcticus TaxID=238540 RepID=A0A3E0E7L1_9BACT|nr:hypothetical protein C8N25_10152 [Algoriphagus antarcticus]
MSYDWLILRDIKSKNLYGMQRNKKIFLILFVIFMLIMGWIGYDISQRTTFPGSKRNLEQRIGDDLEKDEK